MSADRRCPKCRGRVAEPALCVNGHPQPDDPYERLAAVLGEHIDYDRLAELVAARLRRFVADLTAQVPETGQLVDANTIARLTAMSPSWVYNHADELGAIRRGTAHVPVSGSTPGLCGRGSASATGTGRPRRHPLRGGCRRPSCCR